MEQKVLIICKIILYAVFQKCLWREPFWKVSLKVPLKNKHKNHWLKRFYNLQNNFVCSVPKNILEENPFEKFLCRSLKKTKIKTIEQKVLIICKLILYAVFQKIFLKRTLLKSFSQGPFYTFAHLKCAKATYFCTHKPPTSRRFKCAKV